MNRSLDMVKQSAAHLTGGRLSEEELNDLTTYIKRFANTKSISELENVNKLGSVDQITKSSIIFRINQLKRQFQPKEK